MLKDSRSFMSKQIKIPRLCPICSGVKKTLIYKQCFSYGTVSLMEGYDVVICQGCGFAFADDIPSQADFNDYYALMSKYEFNNRKGCATKEYIEYFTKIVDFLLPYLPDKEAKILDIGCSTGGLLSIFKSKGYKNLLGIDPSPQCVETARALYKVRAAVGTISDFNPVEKFDLVILSAVLEHLVDFVSAIQQIRSLLNEKGLLLVAVPDVERFSSYLSPPFQQFSVEHINYFSLYSIRNLLARFSFKEIAARRDEHKLNQAADPEIISLSKKTGERKFKIIHDNVSEPSLKDYVVQCSAADQKLRQLIRVKLADKKEIIVWGAGTFAQRLLGRGLDPAKIAFFVDSNRRYAGKKIDGLEIKPPEEIKEGLPILIATYSYQEEIKRQIIDELKLKNEIITLY